MKRLLLTTAFFLAVPSVRASVPYDAYRLGSPQVRAELHISHSLAVRILNNLNEVARLNRGGTMGMEEAREQESERKRTPPESLEREVMGWLSPVQKQRLEQIELQDGGPFLFEDWPFSRRVGLSLQQHKKLQLAFDRAFQQFQREEQKLSKSNASWYGFLDRKCYASKYAACDCAVKRIEARWQTTLEAALSRSLTRTQKASWQRLLGKPFRARLTYDTKSYPMN